MSEPFDPGVGAFWKAFCLVDAPEIFFADATYVDFDRHEIAVYFAIFSTENHIDPNTVRIDRRGFETAAGRRHLFDIAETFRFAEFFQIRHRQGGIGAAEKLFISQLGDVDELLGSFSAHVERVIGFFHYMHAEMDQKLFLYIEIRHLKHRVSEAVGLDNRVHDFSSVGTFICSGRPVIRLGGLRIALKSRYILVN